MITLYVRCQTKDYILDIVAARVGMRINKDNSVQNSPRFFHECSKWPPHVQSRHKLENQW